MAVEVEKDPLGRTQIAMELERVFKRKGARLEDVRRAGADERILRGVRRVLILRRLVRRGAQDGVLGRRQHVPRFELLNQVKPARSSPLLTFQFPRTGRTLM